jgi:hypothetical protein
MIEELKQLLTMIQDMPEMVVHVLLGFGIYKLVIFMGTSAGIYGTVRFGINKWHDYKIHLLNTPVFVEYKVGDKCLSAAAINELERLLDEMRDARTDGNKLASKLRYVAESEIALTRKLLREYRVSQKSNQ